MIAHRIYYEDGSIFDGDPFAAPRLGVQVIVQRDHRVGYRWVSGEDYFYFEPERGGWETTAIWGMYDHLIRAARPLVLFGRRMDDARWHELFQRAKMEMGEKQGWLAGEDDRR